MKRTNHLLLLLIAVLLGNSCTVPLRDLTYVNGAKTGINYKSDSVLTTYKVQPNDLLYIQVNSEDPKTSDFLNLLGSSIGAVGTYNIELVTYEVNESGEVSYPQLGVIKVAGLTVDEIGRIVQERVDQYIANASVFVKLVERGITVLGEVKNPGRQNMVRNQLTIFEALGSAGDITDFGNRKNIKLIRKNKEGTKVAYIDLTDPALMSSPNYIILPHDVIYVQPLSKVYGKKTMSWSTGSSLIFASLSAVLLIANLFD